MITIYDRQAGLVYASSSKDIPEALRDAQEFANGGLFRLDPESCYIVRAAIKSWSKLPLEISRLNLLKNGEA